MRWLRSSASRRHGEDGASYITQAYACQGRLAGVYRKRHLGEGEEGYARGTQPALFQLGALRFGIAICAEGGVDYPFDEPAASGAQVIFFCAAPGLYGRRTGEESWRTGHAGGRARGSGTPAATQPGPAPGLRWPPRRAHG